MKKNMGEKRDGMCACVVLPGDGRILNGWLPILPGYVADSIR